MRNLIEALTILGNATPGGMEDNWPFSAEHDIIYSRVDADAIPEDSRHGGRLVELGWHFDAGFGVWAKHV